MKNIILTLTLAVGLFTGCGEGGSGGAGSASSGSSGGSVGKGGSMARFAINGDYLYTVDRDAMRVFDISEPSRPYPYAKVRVAFDVQTLFAYKEYLFIGGESGMYIYDAHTPAQPEKISQFTHMRSCDPVVIYEDLAFITLNKGSTCRLQSGENTLQVVDVKDPLNPKLLKTVGMWSPKGLGVDENGTLFVCDGSAGLKIFHVNKTEDNRTGEVQVVLDDSVQKPLQEVDCYDVIPHQKRLIVSSYEDVRQYDYTHFPLVELSRIK